MTLSETGTWPAGVNIHAGSGDMTFTGYGQAYSTSIQGGSGTLNVDLSGSNDFGVTLSTGSGQVTFKSNTGASHVSVTVAGEANWHDGNVIDFNGQSESHFTFNGTGGQFVDLTQSSIIAPHYMTLNDDTFVVNSDTMDGVVDLSGSNATVQTADAALDLHSLTSSDLQFSSTNGTGTTFTVANAAVGLDVLGGAGNNDTLIGDGFSFTAGQRAEIFNTHSIEVITDSSGSYANSGGQTLDARPGGDLLVGGSGADTIIAGAGNDILIGNAGSDTFVFHPVSGNDTVADYTPGTDILQFDEANFADVATLLAATHDDANSHAVISYDAGNTVTLNVDTATLTNHQTDIHLVMA